MLLFIKCLPRMFKMANQDILRHFSLTFSSILSIAIALFIAMVMGLFAMNISYMTQGLEEEFIIQVSLKPGISQENIDSLSSSIENLEEVDFIEFSSKDDELNQLIEESGDIFSQYKESNPLYDVLIVHLNNSESLEKISSKIEKMNDVVKVNYGGSLVLTLISLMAVIRKWGYVFVVIMALLAIYLIRTTIKLAIQTRKDEIMIMRNVGAMNWYITFPFMLEGMIFGFFGALIPILICILGYHFLYQKLNGILMSQVLKLLPPFPGTIYISLALLIVGLVVGMIGSGLAARKYLRWTR
ncbi:permease-like cell division protein FtsX [Floccifex sp.]|uniref:permease-like cell division protein FtsX n=1 Tax=Floccifex sp. TaxID=2815810 RepID=UPI003F0C86C9